MDFIGLFRTVGHLSDAFETAKLETAFEKNPDDLNNDQLILYRTYCEKRQWEYPKYLERLKEVNSELLKRGVKDVA